MAAAASATVLTAAVNTTTEVYAATAGAKAIVLVNESGAPVDIYLDSQAVASYTIPGLRGQNQNTLVLSNDTAQLRVQANCPTAALRLRRTQVTA